MYINIFIIFSSLFLVCVTTIGLGQSLFPLLITFVLADLSFPLVKKLEKISIKREIAVISVFILILSILIILSFAIVPSLISDLTIFIKEFPKHISNTLNMLEEIAKNKGLDISYLKQNIVSIISEKSSNISFENILSATNILKGTLNNFVSIILSLLSIFLFPLFYFYIIYDFEKISNEIENLLPLKYKTQILNFYTKSNCVLQGYLRGQLAVAITLGSIYAISLSIIGLKFGIIIGILTGIFSVIPYVGVTFGLLSSLSIAFASSMGAGFIIIILSIFTIVQILESFFLTPKLVGDKVGLNSLTTILAFIIFGNLLGFLGLLIAIPATGIIKYLFLDLKNLYKNSTLYKVT